MVSTAVRYTRNIDGLHQNKSELIGSGIGNSFLGIAGQEDLGGGTTAFFTLEHGIDLDSGTSVDAATFWECQATLGLRTDWGTVSLGRQYNALNNVAWSLNPLVQGWGVYWSDPVYIGGDIFYQDYRIDNSIVYQHTTGPVQWQVEYGFGEQPGSARRGQTLGAGMLYRQGPWAFGLAYDQQRSANGDSVQRTYALGASYAWAKTTLYTGHLGNRDSANGSAQHISYLGLGYQLGAATHLSGAYYHYRQNRHTTVLNSPQVLGQGRAHAVAAVLDYALSERTHLYLEADITRMRGGAVGRETHYWGGTPVTTSSHSTRTAAMAGVRHAF